MRTGYENTRKPVEAGELLANIEGDMQKLADLVVQDATETNMSGYDTAPIPELGVLSWLQIHHELHVRITQRRTRESTPRIEFDRMFDVTETGCRPQPDDNNVVLPQDRKFKISVPDEATGLVPMYWVDQSSGALVAPPGTPELPLDELEAFSKLPADFVTAAPAALANR